MQAEKINEQASLWLAREQNGLTGEEQAARDSWLEESPRNMVAYLRLKSVWERAGRLAVLKAPSRAAAQPGNRWLVWSVPTAAAAMLALVYWGSADRSPVPQPAVHREAIYSTQLGQTRSYRLADGTRMHLNTNTRVKVDFNNRSRSVTLVAGEAFFEVGGNARQPFVVNAGNRRVTDIGTKFAVYLDGDSVRVLVSEGRVRVETRDGVKGPAPVIADAGHAVIVQGMEAMVFSKPLAEIAQELTWQDGMLTFDQLPLPEVAKAFNRYNARQIQVEGKARRIRIGGSFKADNVDAFVLLLQQGFGLSVKNRGDKILVCR